MSFWWTLYLVGTVYAVLLIQFSGIVASVRVEEPFVRRSMYVVLMFTVFLWPIPLVALLFDAIGNRRK